MDLTGVEVRTTFSSLLMMSCHLMMYVSGVPCSHQTPFSRPQTVSPRCSSVCRWLHPGMRPLVSAVQGG